MRIAIAMQFSISSIKHQKQEMLKKKSILAGRQLWSPGSDFMEHTSVESKKVYKHHPISANLGYLAIEILKESESVAWSLETAMF